LISPEQHSQDSGQNIGIAQCETGNPQAPQQIRGRPLLIDCQDKIDNKKEQTE